VLYVKPGPTKNFCIVDAAMNDLARPAMYGAWMRIVECDARPGRGAGVRRRRADLRIGRLARPRPRARGRGRRSHLASSPPAPTR
jgi:hypothetical protein